MLKPGFPQRRKHKRKHKREHQVSMPIENERRRAQRVAQEKGHILILALYSCLLL